MGAILDVTRDARWGRCAECPGEDPRLGAEFGTAMVAGFQGDDLSRPQNVMATAKHFAGYGLVEAGRDYNAVDASAYRMHNVVLPPFRAAVAAGVGAVIGELTTSLAFLAQHTGSCCATFCANAGALKASLFPTTPPSSSWYITA